MNKMFTQPTGPIAKQNNKQAIARHFGVKQSEVVYFSVGVVLSGYKVIYDKETQRAYSLPADLGLRVTAVSLSSAGVLTHSAGSVDLGALAVARGEYVTLPGSFATGVTVNAKNELVVFTDGKYRWDGTLPKKVPANSTPETSGGVGVGAWISVGDATLRAELAAPTGAELIGHNNTTVGDTLDSIIVRSDQFSSLQEWASYPAKHKTLAGGTYTLDSTLSVECESLTAEGVVTINASGSFVTMHFGTNQRDLLTTLSSDISKGLTSLTVDNVQEGDTLCFYNPSDFSWSGYRNYYRSGEFVKVVRYSDGIAYFNGGTKAAYPSGTQVYKLKTKKVSVSGTFVFNFPSYDKTAMAMQFEQIADGNFDNLVVTSHTAPYAVQFKRCFNLTGKGMRLTQESPSVSFGLEYGCYICNSQNIDFEGIFCAERHSVTVTGNDEICGIVNRFISINASGGGAIMTTGQGKVAAADWHGNTEKCRYGGYIQGLACGGSKNSAHGAHIDHVPNTPAWPNILATELKSIEFDLSNIHVTGIGDPSSVNRGCIDFGGNSAAFGANTVEPGTLNLSGAVIDSPASVLIEIRNRGSLAAHTINLNGVTANAESGKYTVRIAPLSGGISPSDVYMAGFKMPVGSISQINNLASVNVHGVSKKGRSSITIPNGASSAELTISFDSTVLGAPKSVQINQSGTVPASQARVVFSERTSSSTELRVIAAIADGNTLSADLTISFSWRVDW